MKDFDLQKDFIEYWDEVVRQWFKLDVDSKEDINPNGFVGVAAQQSTMINAVNENCKNKRGVVSRNYILNTMHMPEPYWGNPLNCSIVLLDYNPAGGPEPNCHTTIKYKDGDESGMKLIKYVKNHGYSSFATECPVFSDAKDLEKKGMGWFCAKKVEGGKGGYEGYHWWQSKREWLDHLVEAICGKKDEKKDRPLPFGMELCGWHSKMWKNNKWIDNCRDIVDQRAIQPLFAAMKNSLGNSPIKIAVCIGSEFSSELLGQFFNEENVKLINVTEKNFNGLLNKNISEEIKNDPIAGRYEDLTYSLVFQDGYIHVIASWKKNGKEVEPKNRKYRIYKISEGDESYYILNHYYKGKNTHPGEHFWPFEKVLIDTIKKG